MRDADNTSLCFCIWLDGGARDVDQEEGNREPWLRPPPAIDKTDTTGVTSTGFATRSYLYRLFPLQVCSTVSTVETTVDIVVCGGGQKRGATDCVLCCEPMLHIIASCGQYS